MSSARHGQPAVPAPSRPLGYVDNGISRTSTPTGAFELQHVRLHARGVARRRPAPAEISGAEACLPWFGIESVS